MINMNMDEDELKNYYDNIATGENEDFIDNIIDILINDYNDIYNYEVLDENREEIIDNCKKKGFGD